MAKVEINPYYCKGCKLCILACKRDVIKIGQDTNGLGYQYVVVDKMENCIACKMCAVTCPEAAIEIYK